MLVVQLGIGVVAKKKKSVANLKKSELARLQGRSMLRFVRLHSDLVVPIATKDKQERSGGEALQPQDKKKTNTEKKKIKRIFLIEQD